MKILVNVALSVFIPIEVEVDENYAPLSGTPQGRVKVNAQILTIGESLQPTEAQADTLNKFAAQRVAELIGAAFSAPDTKPDEVVNMTPVVDVQ